MTTINNFRKRGRYKVCHPYSMSRGVIGLWCGRHWKFNESDIEDGCLFDDDDLQWINEKRIK